MSPHQIIVTLVVMGSGVFIFYNLRSLLYGKSIFKLISVLREKDNTFWVRLGSPVFIPTPREISNPFKYLASLLKLSGWFLCGGRGATCVNTSKAAQTTRRYFIASMLCLIITGGLFVSAFRMSKNQEPKKTQQSNPLASP